MSAYYYTVSSLPLLQWGSEPELELEEFFEICRTQVPENLMCYITGSIDTEGESDFFHPVLHSWKMFDTMLRYELAEQRSKKLNISSENYKNNDGTSPLIAEAVRLAVSAESPLEAEKILMQAQWEYLDELETGFFFSLENLIVYSLKLQILIRNRAFSSESGLAEFNRIFSNIKSSIKSI